MMVKRHDICPHLATRTDGDIVNEEQFVDLEAELVGKGKKRSFGYFISVELEEMGKFRCSRFNVLRGE